MEINKKNSIIAITLGIICLLYYLIVGQLFIIISALAGPAVLVVIIFLIIPICLSVIGFSIAVHVTVKGGRKILSFPGIVINFLVLCIAVVTCIIVIPQCIVDIDRKYNGYSSGFNYDRTVRSSIMCAVRSQKTEFDVDDVTLDFYFGWLDNPPSEPGHPNLYQQIVFGLYFGNDKAYNISIQNLEDYKDIDDHYFIKEIDVNEFVLDKYYVSMEMPSGKAFSQNERFTVPKELFDQDSGVFYFWVRNIWSSNNNNQFFTQDGGYVKINYEFIDENTVRLNK